MLAYSVPSNASFTRRGFVLAAAASVGCARRKGRGFPGYAFISDAGARTVSAVDLTSFVLARQIGMEAAPSAIVSSLLRPAAYVLIPETGAVCEIDAAKLAVVRKSRAGNPAVSMRSDADGKSLWILQPRALVRLDANHLRTAQSIALPGVAGDFDLTSDGHAAVTFQQDRRIALIKLATGAIEHLAGAGCEPSMVRFQPDGKQVVIGSRADRSMTIFDTASGRIAVRLPLPIEPLNACYESVRRPTFRHRHGHGRGGHRLSLPDRSRRDHSRRKRARRTGRLRHAVVPFRSQPNDRERDRARYRHPQAGRLYRGRSAAAPHPHHPRQSLRAGAELAVRQHGLFAWQPSPSAATAPTLPPSSPWFQWESSP